MKVYRSNRVERLADALAELLRRSPGPDPMVPETLVVHSTGMGRWLSMRLAEHLGITANIEFPFPGKLLHTILGAVTEDQDAADPDAAATELWTPSRLIWPILTELQGLFEGANAEDPAFAPLRAFIANDPTDPREAVSHKLLGLAGQLAELYDRYIVYRPDLIRRWDEPSDGMNATPADGHGNGDGEDWQPKLWRRLRARIDAPHLAQRAQAFASAVEAGLPDAARAKLPKRVCLFGISTLPPFYVDLLRVLAEVIEVHLFVLCPSEKWWGHIRSRRDQARELRVSGDSTDPIWLHMEEGHPILASFGRLGRDFQVVLEGSSAHTPYTEPRDDLFVDPIPLADDSGSEPTQFDLFGPSAAPEPEMAPPTALQWLQSDLLHLRNRGVEDHEGEEATGRGTQAIEAERNPKQTVLLPGDRSIALHGCYGPMRQVEVLRDILLTRFTEDPTLEPRDIVVMTPDIEAYAPLIEAVFSEGEAADPFAARAPGTPPALPFRISDRTLRTDNPVAEALLRVLELASGRANATNILDLLSLPPVAKRFGLTSEDLPQLAVWVHESGIRWGVDAAHRGAQGQPELVQNTWRFGLDRLLVGQAMPGEGVRAFAGVLPYDEIEGGAARLLGRFVDMVDTLFRHLEAIAAPAAMDAWAPRLLALLDDLIQVDERQVWLEQEVRGVIEGLAKDAVAGACVGKLTLAAMNAHLSTRFTGRPRASGFSSGAITFCAMVPMRSVPFRVVVLLGLDDDAFPRPSSRLRFDRTVQKPRLGDKSPREEDRTLLLETILAARDAWVVLYTSRGMRDNQPRPPAVPIAEILDGLSTAFAPPTNSEIDTPDLDLQSPNALRTYLTTEHPLQPFSPQIFGADGGAAQSFQTSYLNGAQALAETRAGRTPNREKRPFFSHALAPIPDEERKLTVRDLVRFMAGPTQSFLSQRLKIVLRGPDDALGDREPMELDGLERWACSNDLLQRVLAGQNPELAMAGLRAEGLLPLGVPGDLLVADLLKAVTPIAHAAQGLIPEGVHAVSVDLDIDKTHITGHISDCTGGARVVVQVGSMRARHILSLWVQHLMLRVADPGFRDGKSHLIARSSERGQAVGHLVLGAVKNPRRELLVLSRMFWAGMRAPILFFPKTSMAFALRYEREVLAGRGEPMARRKADYDARQAWAGGWQIEGEAADPAIFRVFEAADVVDEGYLPTGFTREQVNYFPSLARRIWQPIIDCAEGLL